LDTATETKTVAGEGKGILVEYAWKLKKRQLQESTINNRTFLLNQLIDKGADLNNTDSVETVLATEPFTVCKKHQLVAAYRSYTKVFQIPWEPIKIKYSPKKPFVPLEAELDQLIAASGKRTAAFLQTLKDTGARCGELCKLKTTDVDEAKLTVTISCPEKGSNSRTVKVSEKTIAMLKTLSNKYAPYVFNPNPRLYKDAIATVRKRLAQTMQNDRFRQIHLHSFRHWKATTEYAKTLNLPHVMEILGHKNVNNTMIYMHLAKFEVREYETAYASTLKEEDDLLKAGFNFIRFNEKEQVAVYRRRE
jgi:integrase